MSAALATMTPRASFDASLTRLMAAMARARRAIDAILFDNDRALERVSSALSKARSYQASRKISCEAMARRAAPEAHRGELPERRARGANGTFQEVASSRYL
jgi:hypothetical protein